EQIHRLLWTFHTIILDGWSRQTLLNEVSACYLSLSQGQAAPGGTCRPYRDYITWLQRQDVKQAEQFWRSSLRGFRHPTELGRQQKRESVQKPQKLSEMVQGRLSEEESVALHTVASQHDITLSTLLQGVWTLLLSHYSRSRDVVFGVTVSGRPAELVGVETIVGLCINTLPLRVQLPKHGAIWTWLEGLQRYNMELQAYEYVSAGQVHQWSEMVGSSPLYESLLVVENYPAGVGTAHEESGTGVGDAVYQEAQTRYPLTLLIADGVRLSIRCIYDTRRFERGSVELILQQFQHLVRAVVTEEYEQIEALERLIAQEPLPLVYTTPRQTYPKKEESYQTQRSPLEELVESVWKEAFGLEHISRECNFFALGGHSLLATQVMSRMRQILQREIPLRVLFEHPTIATLSSQLEILRQGETHFSAPTFPPTLPHTLLPMERSQEIPLSFAQERLWFLNQLEPLNYANHFPTAVHLRGQISVMALERALQQLIERHESLRTTFVSQQGRPVQVIAPVLSLPLCIIDVEASGEAARDELMRTFFRLPFDLAHGPLVRLYLLRLEEQVHVLLVNMHHIVTDDWSVGILVRELSTLYQAQVQASPIMLPALPIQYADYALWQRQWLQGEVLEDQLTYWKQQLADAPALLELPTDHPRPKAQTFAGSLQRRLFSPELLRQLQQLSQQEGVTLFMTLLAAFQVLLMRYSGQADIMVGSPLTNRTSAETEGLIGRFANTLVLRCDLSGQPSFRELLARVREVTLQAYEHQEAPFEQVVEALQVEHSLSHSPLFQVLFVLQNTPEVSMNGAGLTWNSVEIEQTTTRFDLSLHLREGVQGLYVGLEYNSALFEASSIVRMLDHWQNLVTCIAQRPAQRITEIPLLTQNEREQILVQWNQAASLSEAPLWLHEHFERQVAHTPDAIAVVFEQQHLSYYLLNKRANRLARTLQKRGVGPDALVGICLERSAELVVAVLAVLKAGGAYVPFDPTAPAQRLTALIADAGVRLMLTEPAILPLLTDHAIPALLVPSAEEEGASDTETEKVTSQIQGEHLAYMIYTSGSTGKPKGAMNTHRGIGNRLAWMQQTYSLTALDRVVQKTPMTFDVSVWEMLWPLLSGAVLVVAEPGGHQDPHYLKELVQQQGISTMHFVPSILQAFLEEPELRSACKSLRQVMCSGEAFTPELQARFFARLPEHVRLHNLYGPTEAAIGITSWSCSPGEHSVPIGRPIANTQIYVLDERGQPVPVGVRGELYIGGVSLARGYHGRPDLTGERFVPDPYGPNLGSRLYRTGDLVRYRADGAIEYLGRLDHQVKLRGMRIEPGEIEALLRAHPAILEAVVLAREERPGDIHLVAYLVGRQGQRPAPGEVRSYLQEHLPPPMIPSALVFLDALPLMPNGKLDRRALPAPEPNSWPDEMVGPSTPLEEVTLLIWADLLHLAPSQISIHDNFFALGGHSLLATQVISRLRQVLQVEVPLRTLFEAPTIAELTRRIDAQRYGSRQEAIPALVPVKAAEIELSFAQERLWFLYQLESHSSFYNMPFVLHPVGRLSVQALEHSLAVVVQRHDILRTTFVMRQDQPVQMIAPALTLPLPIVDLSGLDSTEQ
ncbi:MAG TPA: amino acid adenylation domain-containing protein, partial [Ktedonobacteraceae bacterium]|nr:amino acid adenylation domain-containing protein [Ktedonobacteraceae bacterium]